MGNNKIYVAKAGRKLREFHIRSYQPSRGISFLRNQTLFHSGNANCHQLIVPVHPEVIIGIPISAKQMELKNILQRRIRIYLQPTSKPGLSFFLHFHRIGSQTTIGEGRC